MREKENVTLIQKIYAAFGAGDIQTILSLVDSNAEWVNYGPTTIPYAGNFNRRIPGFFQAIGESTMNGKVTADKYIAQDDTVVAIGRYSATVRNTGSKIDTPIAHTFTIRDGKVTSWIGFSDSAAVAAAHSGSSASAG